MISKNKKDFQIKKTNENEQKEEKETKDIKVYIKIKPILSKISANKENQNKCISQIDSSSINYLSNNKYISFTYSYVFNEKTTQPLFYYNGKFSNYLRNVLEGENVLIIFNGENSSGKRYSLFGDRNYMKDGKYIEIKNKEEAMGIVPRMIIELYNMINKSEKENKNDYNIKISFIEIYNENLKDLLNPTQKVSIEWSRKEGYFIKNSVFIECVYENEALEVVSEGLCNMSKRSNYINEENNQSNLVLILSIINKRTKGISFLYFTCVGGLDKVYSKSEVLYKTLISLEDLINVYSSEINNQSKLSKKHIYSVDDSNVS